VAATRFTISQTISIETHIASPKTLTIVYWDIHQSHKILRRGPMNHQDGEWWEYWILLDHVKVFPKSLQ
jgi:hypothetical protein